MKNKKVLVLLYLFVFLFVGVTVAYFFNKTTLKNNFDIADFGTTATETFTSPTNWKPGDTTEKIVTITNNKTLPVAVRVSYEEEWYDEDDNLINAPVDAVTLNVVKSHRWRKEGNYYYYIYPLLEGESINYLESVTFNEEVGDNLNCTTEGNVETCSPDVETIDGGTYKLIITIETTQYDKYEDAWNTDIAIEPKEDPESFATDSWDTIVDAIESGDNIPYEVGDTKEIEMDVDGDGTPETYTLRIANTSTPEACNTDDFSQTACGFVLEFVNVINHQKSSITNTNAGGWRDSFVRSYVNTNIYNAFPDILKDSIIDTKVISGHGNISGEENYETVDKIYLLSSVEVWGTTYHDTVTAENPALTRQLDYYSNLGVTQSNASACIKKKYNNSNNAVWWLRVADSTTNFRFSYVKTDGKGSDYSAISTGGVSPAFRIG